MAGAPVIRALLFGVLLAAPLAGAAQTHLDAGLATAAVQWSETPSCSASLPNLPCLAGHDPAGTPVPFDDTIYVYHSVETASVEVHAPGSAETIHVHPRNTGIQHEGINTLDGVLVPAEAAIPSPVGDHISHYPTRTESYLAVRGPSIAGNETTYFVPFWIPFTNRTGTWLPGGVGPNGASSESIVGSFTDGLRLCWIHQASEEDFAGCDLLPATHLDSAMDAWTPAVVLGIAVNGTTIHLGPGSHHDASMDGVGGAPALADGTGVRAVLSRVDADTGSAPEVRPVPSPARSWIPKPPAGQGWDAPPLLGPAIESASATNGLWEAAVLAFSFLLPLAWLYHRIAHAQTLQHRHRAALFQIASERPGILLGEAARHLGVSFHCAHHHARTLARSGHVDLVRVGRFLALYAGAQVPHAQRAAHAHLRRGPLAATLRDLALAPGLGVSELARRQGRTKSSTHARLRRLAGFGLAACVAETWSLTPAGQEALRALPPSPPGPPTA